MEFLNKYKKFHRLGITEANLKTKMNVSWQMLQYAISLTLGKRGPQIAIQYC